MNKKPELSNSEINISIPKMKFLPQEIEPLLNQSTGIVIMEMEGNGLEVNEAINEVGSIIFFNRNSDRIKVAFIHEQEKKICSIAFLQNGEGFGFYINYLLMSGYCLAGLSPQLDLVKDLKDNIEAWKVPIPSCKYYFTKSDNGYCCKIEVPSNYSSDCYTYSVRFYNTSDMLPDRMGLFKESVDAMLEQMIQRS